MGLYSDNFYSWQDRLFAKEKAAWDAMPDSEEEKHPRAKKGESKGGKKNGGQFIRKNKTYIEQDDISGSFQMPDEEAPKLKLPNGKKIDADFAILYKDEKDTLLPHKFSPFLKKTKGVGKVSPEMDSVLDRLFGGEDVPDEEIEAIPEWKEAMERAADLEDRIQAEYGERATANILTDERNAMRNRIKKAALSPTISKTVPIEGMDVEFETNEGLKEGESYEVEKGRKAFITIGFPAAGKSTTFANPLAKKYKARLCDSDTIKKALPEFSNGYGGNAVHEESTLINEAVLSEAVDRGENVVYPILGYKPEKLRDVIGLFKSKGYEVGLCFKDMPVNIAKGRLLVRFLQKGRYLPLQCISKAKNGLAESFEQNKRIADSYIRTTNPKPYGGEEKVIESKGDIL